MKYLLRICFLFVFASFYVNAQIVVKDEGKANKSTIVITRERSEHDKTTRTFVLKHVEAIELRDVVQSAVGYKGSVQSVTYDDGRSVLIVTAPAYRLKDGGDIEKMINTLDQSSSVVVDDDTRFIYHMQYRSAWPVARMINQLMEGRARATVDREGNALIVHGAPSAIAEVKELLSDTDIRRIERVVEYEIFSVDSSEFSEIGAEFAEWSSQNGHMVGTVIVGDGEDWYQKAFFYFLEENRKARSATKGVQPLNGNSFVSLNEGNNDGIRLHIMPELYDQSVSLQLTLFDGSSTIFSSSLTITEMDKDYVLGSADVKGVVEAQDTLPLLGWLFPGRKADSSFNQKFIIFLRVVDASKSSIQNKMLQDIKKEFKDF